MAAPVLQFKRGLLANLPGLRAGEPGFTTDSYDLYVGIDSTTNNNKFFGSHRYWTKGTSTTGSGVNLVEATNNGSDFITLAAPATVGAAVTYYFPATQGGSSTVLTNDGNGNLTWASGSANPTFTGIATFTDTTDNTLGDANTGAVQIDGGLGVNKNVTVGGNLNVQGYSELVGVVTFKGGTINIGDDTGDNINVGGEFTSGLFPNSSNTYDLGDNSRQWRHASFGGIGTFSTGLVADGVQIGVNGANVIDTVSGNLTLNSAGGQTIIDDLVTIQNNLTVNGNVTVGGTTISLSSQDVFIENKDIVLGYTTSISPNDDTANHGGVAIASTIGTPLANFNASGINTLPDTYKQLMWFKSGTLGFATDAFAFNYGVAIGTTTMADGVRLAVGSGVTVTDTEVSATTFRGNLVGNVTGNVSSADQVKTVTAGNTNATYHITFVDANNGSATNETIYTDDGIYYNPGTNTFTTQYGYFTANVTVDGTITGTATTATRAQLIDTANTTNNSDYYVTFVDTLAGQGSENLRVGLGLSVNPSTGDVKTHGSLSVGSAGAVTSYIKAGGGSNAMYLYSNGDVSFQAKVITNSIRSSSDSNDAITLAGRDATFGNNITVSGIATVTGDLSVNGGDVTTSATTFNLVNATATNVNFAGAATDLVIGATSGITTVRNNLTVGGDLRVNGNDIQASDGNTNITLSSNTLTTFAGDIKVGGNDIQASDGTTAVTLSTTTGDVTIAGDLQVTGNDIKSSTGAVAITLSANDVQITDDLTVGGNLYVNGNTTQVNTSSITVEDRTIELGQVDGAAPSSATTWDLGVLFNYNSSGAKKSGVIWEHADGRFKFGSQISDGGGTDNNSPQITVSNYAAIEVASLWVNGCGSLGALQVVSCDTTQLKLENITIDAGTF